MKKLFFILLFSTQAKAIDLGAFNVTYDFCKEVNKIGSILNAFQLTQWPVAGLPGVVMGISQRTSPIVDMCSYIAQIKNADTSEAIFLSAEKLNDLTRSGFQADLDFSRSAWNLANSQYDFNKGKQRASSLDAVYTASKIGNFMKSLGKYQNARKTREDELNDRETVNDLAKLSRERAILQEQMACPKPKSNAKDYSNVYTNEFQPQIQKKEYFEQDVEFIVQQLKNMAPRFIKGSSPNEEQLKRGKKPVSAATRWASFEKKLQSLIISGVKYKQTKKYENLKNTEKTSEKDVAGAFKTKQVTVRKESQEFSVQVDSSLFSEFSSDYALDWRSWAGDYWAEGTKAFNGVESMKREFAPLMAECNPARLSGLNFDANDLKSQDRLDSIREKCENESYAKNDKTRVLGLFEYYIKELQQSLRALKQAQAKIWTLDSYYLGRHRVVSVNMKDDVAEEQITCSDNLSMADMQMLNLKSQNVNAKLNQKLAEESIKQTAILEAQEERENQIVKDQRMRNEMVRRELEEEERQLNKIQRSVIYGGSARKDN
jgi:hypothetical protein